MVISLKRPLNEVSGTLIDYCLRLTISAKFYTLFEDVNNRTATGILHTPCVKSDKNLGNGGNNPQNATPSERSYFQLSKNCDCMVIPCITVFVQ